VPEFRAGFHAHHVPQGVLLSHSFNQGRSQLDKDTLLRSTKGFRTPTISRLLLLEIEMFKGPKLPKTCRKLNIGASIVVKRDIMPTDAPIHALVLTIPLQLHLPLPMEPILFRLLPSRIILMGGSTMLLWRKPKKLQTLSLVCFPSMTLLQLCCLRI
jgi:hypothetical protein